MRLDEHESSVVQDRLATYPLSAASLWSKPTLAKPTLAIVIRPTLAKPTLAKVKVLDV